MDFLSENIPLLIAFTIAFLILYTVALNLYFIHKNGFSVSVNCWFCNRNSKVPYLQRNSFECCHCLQYNGFTKDGGYNKRIEAQYNAALNTTYVAPAKSSTPKYGNNGLCESCNRNQELKVLQLARYEALDDRNFDREIKHFEQQLEKAYGLCRSCSQTLKRTISRQNAWIFGNKLKSFKHLKGLPEIRGRLNIGAVILMLISFYNLSALCGFGVTVPKVPATLVPKKLVLLTEICYNFTVSALTGSNGLVKYLLPGKALKLHRGLHVSNRTFVSLIAFLINLLLIVPNGKINVFTKLSQVTAWAILGLLSTVHFKSDVALYFETLEVFSSLYLTYIYVVMCLESVRKSGNKFQFKRLKLKKSPTFGEGFIENDSDSDVLDVSNSSFKTAIPKRRSPNTANFVNTAKNGKLNQHFSDLNLGALNDTRSSNRFNNPNVPRSVSSWTNWGPMPESHRLNSSFSGSLFNHRSVSPSSARTEPISGRQRPNSPFTPFGSQFGVSQFPRLAPSPDNASFNNCNLERPPRTLLSPSRLNLVSSDVSSPKMWTTLNEVQFPQRFIVNSFNGGPQLISTATGAEPNGYKAPDCNSRSSSSSSGFGSNGDFVRCLSESLPNSRENSPERCPEPVHF